jgi:hypothetical protein
MEATYRFVSLFSRFHLWIGLMLLVTGCRTCKNAYDAAYVNKAELIEIHAHHLFSRAHEPYSNYRYAAERLLKELESINEHVAGKKNKELAYNWLLIRNEMAIPFIKRWREEGQLDRMFANEFDKQFRISVQTLIKQEHAKPNKNGNNKNLEELPLFPWEPPLASADFDLTPYFRNCRYFAEVWKSLQNALSKSGYPHTYYKVPGGFAVVTQIEQTSDDGTPYYSERWLVDPSNLMEIHSLRDYLNALFYGKIGYSRTITFIITNKRFVQKQIPPQEYIARRWKNNGVLNVTPSTFGKDVFTSNHTVTALVYEFQITKQDFNPRLCLPSRYSGLIHLEKSGLIKYLSY